MQLAFECPACKTSYDKSNSARICIASHTHPCETCEQMYYMHELTVITTNYGIIVVCSNCLPEWI